MVWVWVSVCFLSVLSSELVPAEGQTWIREDLQGKMFSVMNSGYVRFRADNSTSNLTGLTVCLRLLSEPATPVILLSFINQTRSVELSVNDFNYLLYVNGDYVTFAKSLMVPTIQELWPWKNRCFTWESSTGMAQLWADGNMSIRKGIARGQVFSGQVELSFSQFEGQLTDIYVWDRALTVRELFYFLYYNDNFPSDGILNWKWIQYSPSGYTVLEPILVRPFSVKSDRRKKLKKHLGWRRRVHKEKLRK